MEKDSRVALIQVLAGYLAGLKAKIPKAKALPSIRSLLYGPLRASVSG